MSDENLCLECGMCCDGTMYSYVALKSKDEQDRLIEQGFDLVEEHGSTTFRQPCCAYKGARCSVYETRPAVCREYRCALLRACDAGKLSIDEASSLVREVAILRDRVRSLLEAYLDVNNPVSLPRLFRMLNERLESLQPEDRKKVDPQMMLDIGTLRVLISKRFEPAGNGLGKSSEAADEDSKQAGIATATLQHDRT